MLSSNEVLALRTTWFFIPEQPPALRVPGRYFLHLLTRLEVTIQANLFASVVTPMSRQLS